jgi:class 3 adenylate cyclase
MGPAISMTANDRLDYFGRTVNIAARLGDQSRGNDIVILREVFDRAAGRITLHRDNVVAEPFKARLRGMDSEQELVRLAVDQPPNPRTAPDRESTAVG